MYYDLLIHSGVVDHCPGERRTMKYRLTIPGRLDALNEYTSANRTNPNKGGQMKRDNEDIIIWMIRQQLRGLHIESPVLIYYQFYEIDRRRDNDNILSCASKFTQDSLVKTRVLENDTQKFIHRFYFDTHVDVKNPRIEVTITELTKEQAKMDLFELLNDLARVGD
jgi:Holliday junction resolvase RusA-like endonuclease